MAARFDPASIPRYSVVLAEAAFPGDPAPTQKLFVVLFHEDGAAFCMKATTKVGVYLNNPDKMRGAVYYGAGETCFREDTVVQPDNLWPVHHNLLSGPECVVGMLPVDFHDRLIAAVKASILLSESWRQTLLRKLA